MWSSNGKSCCAFLSFWLDPSRPLIKWFDPLAWSINDQVIPFVCVLVRSLDHRHPFLKTGIFGLMAIPKCEIHWKVTTNPSTLLILQQFLCLSESSILTHKTIWSNLSTCHKTFSAKHLSKKAQHLDISSTPFHQKETSWMSDNLTASTFNQIFP